MSLTLTLERGGGEVSGSGTNIELDGTITGGAIESVEMYGDTQQTTYSGKNLLSATLASSPQQGMTITQDADGTIHLTGTATATYANFLNIDPLPYTLSATDTFIASVGEVIATPAIGATTIRLQISAPYQRKDYLVNYGDSSSSAMQVGFAADKVVAFVQGLTSGTTYDITIKNLMIEKGSTATTYEPYVGGTASPNPDYPQEVKTVTGEQTITVSNGQGASQVYPINLGKNLFDKDNVNVLNAYIDGTTTEVVSNASHRTVYIACEPNTTYALQKISTNRSRNVATFTNVPTVGSTGTKMSSLPATTTGTTSSVVITTPSDARYLAINVYFSGQDSAYTFDEVLATLQIEKGSTATTYAPYFTPIELCKIGDYQDYIYKSGEDWYLHKEINKVVFDGSVDEGWELLSTNTNTARFRTYAVNNFAIADSSVILKSDYFTAYPANERTQDKIGITTYSNTDLYVRTSVDAISTVSALTTWLSSHNTSVYYALATPTDTQITNSALITQLEALNAGETYEGTTVITVASENLAGSLEITAATKIAKTYTEVEIGSPFTIADVEGKSSNTTLDGNVYVDWAYNKKQYSFDLFNLTPQDYADIRAYYDYQFSNSAFPTITVPELNIDRLPVYMEISSRNIINQCLLTDKLTIKFRETVQP